MRSGERTEGTTGGHLPVLLAEVVQLLAIEPQGTYLDLTAGGGGHLAALAAVLSSDAKLIGIDKDPEAVARVRERLSAIPQGVRVMQGTFGSLSTLGPELGLGEGSVAGVLLDLGLSSYQLDDAHRGFAFRLDGPLGMQFDPASLADAAEIISHSSESELAQIFRAYGEEDHAKQIARAIVRARGDQPIATTGQLASVVRSVTPPHKQEKSLSRIFQALRIVVNDELGELERVLPAALDLLSSGGRLAVISYHSLEDRIVKQFMAQEAKPACQCPPDFPVCVCKRVPRMTLVTKKPVTPGIEELAANSRSRSAKLRVAQKI